MTQEPSTQDFDLRQAAIARLRKKREFVQHLTVYAVMNGTFTLIWLLTMPGGFFWPMFPIFIWGIGIIFHAMDVYVPTKPSEERIQREMNRLAHR
jgi:predicted membrane channel-forming protein YqfA (hemolysin III family)